MLLRKWNLLNHLLLMKSSPFTTPQRQSEIGILLLTLINFGKFLKAAWPMYVLFFIKGRDAQGYLLFILGTAVVFVFMAVISWLQYRNFSYFINAQTGELVISSGIINRKKISIEKNKIQEVNINQPFIHKLLKIYKLEIDTPGSDKKEVTVNAISYGNAVALKNYLLENRTTADVNLNGLPSGVSQERGEEIRISVASLVKYGLTANYLKSFAALVGFGFYIGQNAIEFLRGQTLEDFIFDREEVIDTGLLQALPLIPIFVLVGALFVLAVIVNLVLNLFIYFGMKILKREDRLSLEYGLLNSKNAIIGRRKVQMITEIQNFLQKKVNVMQLRISQISGDEHHKDSYNTIPGCSTEEKNELVMFIWKCIPRFEHALKPNLRKLVIGHVIFIIIPVIISIFARTVMGNYFWLILLYFILAEVMLIFSFRNSRLFYNKDFLAVQSGIWDIGKKTIETEKIQAVRLSQYFWQKRSDLGAVHFYTAGGIISFKSTGYRKLKALVNYSLYRVESSQKGWM
jgi:putative membrane protein